MGRRKEQRRRELLARNQTSPYEQHIQKLSRSNTNQGYGSVVRRTVFFQFRLAADGIRDLLLSPICVVAALLGLLRPDNPSWALDRLMKFGRVTDRWINLFEQEDEHPADERSQTIDDLFNHVEREVKTRMAPNDGSEASNWTNGFSTASGNKRRHP